MARSSLRRRTIRRPAVVALAACTAVSLAACSKSTDEPETPVAKTINITNADNGKQVFANVGDTVVLSLASNPTTGYTWDMITKPDAAILKLTGMEYKPSTTDTQVAGAGGIDEWRFTAESAGIAEIALDYVGPGTDAEVGQSFDVSVEVT